MPARITTILLCLAAALAGCGAPTATIAPTAAPAATVAPATTAAMAGSNDLTVFAAASLTAPFSEIGKKFEAANPGVTVTFSFAGSQQLAQQIGQGAPADVFASASRGAIAPVIQSGAIVSGTEQIFARNRLVVIYPKDNPAKVAALTDLAKPGLKLVLAAKAVPVGQYALDFLGKASKLPEYTASYSPTVLSNVVSYEDNVKAVLNKVALGEADAGIVYTSDVSGDVAQQVGAVEIPDGINIIASYPIGTLKASAQSELAKRFVAYVLGPEGQAVLTKYGFISVAKSARAPLPPRRAAA